MALLNKSRRTKLHIMVMAISSFMIGFLMSYDEAVRNPMNKATVSGEMGTAEELSSPEDFGETQYEGPSTTLELLGIILHKQKDVMDRLAKEYGKFGRLVFDVVHFDKLFRISTLSKRRLIRRMMIKLLISRIRSNDEYTIQSEEELDSFPVGVPIFNWVTTGDSSAAGHGNAYYQSYTAVLEDTVSNLFRAAGVKFVATNHAGDAWSGMEQALCLDYIFGRDTDVLSWDFSLSNPAEYIEPFSASQAIDAFLLGERAGRVLPNLPFLFMINPMSDVDSYQRLAGLETRGMGTGLMDVTSLRNIILTFPDYANGRQKAPRAVTNFHCGDTIEGKEQCSNSSHLFWCDSSKGSTCAKAKFNAGKVCKNSRYQTSWNDGKKMHLIKGRLLGFFLMEMLRLAAVELDILERQETRLRNPFEALKSLRAEEEVEEFLFSKTQLSSKVDIGESTESWTLLKQTNAICLNSIAVASSPQIQNMTWLYYDPPKESLCEDFLQYQNAHIRLSEGIGWVRIDPQYYSKMIGATRQIIRDAESENGVLLAICLKKCYGNQCGPHVHGVDEIHVTWEKVEIRVNGVLVSGLKRLGGCYFLKNNRGLRWNDQTVAGKSKGINIRVHEGGGQIFLSSVIVLY